MWTHKRWKQSKAAIPFSATIRAAFEVTSAFFAQRQRPRSIIRPDWTPHQCRQARAMVLSILDNHPGLSDCEISRRAGVRSQTVNTRERRWPQTIAERNARQPYDRMNPWRPLFVNHPAGDTGSSRLACASARRSTGVQPLPRPLSHDVTTSSSKRDAHEQEEGIGQAEGS